MFNTINEGAEIGDLKRLVHPELHVDEFKSKLGRDEDVAVLSFKITDREPALDLVNFIEKGYDWVIDADLSSGEMDDGDYIVFVEANREPAIAENVMTMMADIMNLTEQDLSEWTLRYYKDPKKYDMSIESLRSTIPGTADAYKKKFGNEEIDSLKAAAGVEVTTKAPKNDYTESLRVAAGIK